MISDPRPDGRPSALRCLLACLDQPEDGADWIVTVQDDAMPAAGFTEGLCRAILDCPDQLIALFVGGHPRRSAQLVEIAARRGERYCHLDPRDFMPTVAVAWPAQHARSFVAWCAEGFAPPEDRDDDCWVGKWARDHGVGKIATVPSLVEHPDDVRSLVRRRPLKPGRTRMRNAAVPPR